MGKGVERSMMDHKEVIDKGACEMLTQVKLRDWVLQIDTERTVEVYSKRPSLTDKCNCLGCRNYMAAISQLPPRAQETFALLGIDPSKAGEVYPVEVNADGTHLYNGRYFFVGQILVSPETTGHFSHIGSQITMSKLSSDFSIGLTANALYPPKSFPQPLLQLEFNCHVPWVIAEQPFE